jgi:hypothetical protein
MRERQQVDTKITKIRRHGIRATTTATRREGISPNQSSESVLQTVTLLESVSIDKDLVATHHRPRPGRVRDTRYINTKFHHGVTRTPDNR